MKSEREKAALDLKALEELLNSNNPSIDAVEQLGNKVGDSQLNILLGRMLENAIKEGNIDRIASYRNTFPELQKGLDKVANTVNFDRNVLRLSISHKKPEILGTVLNSWTISPETIFETHNETLSPLHFAAMIGDSESVKLLSGKISASSLGTEISASSLGTENIGKTVIHLLLERQTIDPTMVLSLLNKMDKGDIDKHKDVFLKQAILMAQPELVKDLISRGAVVPRGLEVSWGNPTSNQKATLSILEPIWKLTDRLQSKIDKSPLKGQISVCAFQAENGSFKPCLIGIERDDVHEMLKEPSHKSPITKKLLDNVVEDGRTPQSGLKINMTIDELSRPSTIFGRAQATLLSAMDKVTGVSR